MSGSERKVSGEVSVGGGEEKCERVWGGGR